MIKCEKCGAEVQDGVNFCPSCGHKIGAEPTQEAQGGQSAEQRAQVPQEAGAADAKDAEENKTMAIIAYILFFVPLATGAHKNSPFVKYHTNQGTILFIVAVAYSILSSILRAVVKVQRTTYVLGIPATYTATPGWLGAILWIGNLAITALCILGIVNALKGRMKELPVIGKFTIIK